MVRYPQVMFTGIHFALSKHLFIAVASSDGF
jgi:hypothetical protein